jgi:predicted Ser/Thr protein kinase/tetratricopeptide (TPR) repeat protein
VADSTLPAVGTETQNDARAPEHEPDEDEPRFLPGDRIGRYVLLSSLGKGGMSVVYLAYDPELDRKVALKLMRMTMLGEKGKLRLQREAQALARLSHPNVVPVYDAGMVGDQAFVAMEFVEGKTLRKWLQGEHTWRQKLEVMLDAGRGLAAAHAAGLIHRDFKPDNVLIGDDKRVRVLDFGLARLASVIDGSAPLSSPSLDDPPSSEGGVPMVPSSNPALMEVTRDNQLIGTPAYMAPEQMMMRPTDERADQFAFCVTLYEAVYGERPYDVVAGAIATEASTMSIATRATLPRTPRAMPRGSDVPKWIQRAITRGMSDDPAARFPTMDDLLRALTTDPNRKWRRLGVAAVGLAALVTGGAFVARAQNRTRALCHGGEARVATVWNPSARAELASAFAKTGVSYADIATATLTRALDAYARDWAAMDDDACAATRLRGEQAEDALELRMSCLSGRLEEMTALVDLVRRADVETVQQASRTAEALAPLASCADIAALRSRTPRPRDPAAAAKIDELDRRVAIVKANYDVGKVSDAAKLGDQLLADAKPLDFLPLTAKVDYWRGRAAAELGDSDHSIPAFRDAFTEALASRSDDVMRESAARLAQEYVYAEKVDEFHTWADVADAAIARTGPDEHDANFLAHVRCVAMWQSGALQTRLACLEKYREKVEKKRPLNDWELVTIGLAAADAGELARGLAWLKEGYAYSLKENGPTHPRTTEMRVYLCMGLMEYGDLDGALVECKAAREEIAKAPADNSKDVIEKVHLYMGGTLLRLHRYDEAKKELEAAGDDGASDLSEVESETGHYDAAIAYLKSSLADVVKTLPAGHSNVITSEVALAEAQLESGAVADALGGLESATRAAENAELSPFARVTLDFALARALWRTDPSNADKAVALAENAKAVLSAHAPATFYYQNKIHVLERWLRDPKVRAQAYAVMDPATREPW